MRAMKDSGIEWIGQVPESWESRSLKYALPKYIKIGGIFYERLHN